MKHIKFGLKTFFLYYVGINFLVSFVVFVTTFTGANSLMLCAMALLVVLGSYWGLRKSLTPEVIWMNMGILLMSTLLFSLAMLVHQGSGYGILFDVLSTLALPFCGLLIVLSLYGVIFDFYLILLGILLLEVVLAFGLQYKQLKEDLSSQDGQSTMDLNSAKMPQDGQSIRRRTSIKRITKSGLALLLIVVVLGGMDGYLYSRRPEARYGGHGFNYMNGFSSTDFKDYTVYCDDKMSKLVKLDHRPELQITNKEDMPIMDGAEACYPVYAAMAKACYVGIEDIEKEYQKKVASREITYNQNGEVVTFTNTLNGFSRLIYKEIDLFFSAKPSQEQMEEAKEEGVDLEITPIGREAFVFFVEADNPIEDLTSEQIRQIYHGDITNWKEVGGPDQEILAFQRPRNSGSQTMMEYFMGDVSLKEPKTYETVGAMEGVITNVAQYNNEEGAMGYSFRYFVEDLNQEKNVKVLSIDGVKPSLDTIEDGTYPLTVGLCLITRKNDPSPNVQKMIDFCLSPDGQQIIRETGYGRVQ